MLSAIFFTATAPATASENDGAIFRMASYNLPRPRQSEQNTNTAQTFSILAR
jgi:hypothetical protein